MEYMAATHLREKLLQERQQYHHIVETMAETGLGGTVSIGDQYQEDSTHDNHPGDMGTEMFEREKDLGLRSNCLRRMADIDIALERMQLGTYGVCEECGQPIPAERLDVFPSALCCVHCQEAREALPDPFHRPIEEQVLSPPFGRTWRDKTGDPGYDGEDTWQDAAQHGTSETPQDVPGALKFDDLYHSDEEVYTIVDPMDALVDEDGEPLQREDRDDDAQTDWAAHLTDTLYGPQDMAGNYHWRPASEHHTTMPERQFRRGQFPSRIHRMPSD